jgi:hypothetical protein
MSGKAKSKKSSQAAVYDPNTQDSLVGALAGEILAPENLNLLVPITMFAVVRSWVMTDDPGSCSVFLE